MMMMIDKYQKEFLITSGEISYLSYVGLDNRLFVRVEPAKRQASCVSNRHTPPYASCKELVSKLRYATERVKFGAAGQPGVVVTLPRDIKSSRSFL